MQLNKDTLHWRHWLYKRGITDSVIDSFNISWGPTPLGEDGIVIPLPNGVNKYRRDPLIDAKPKYIQDQGAKLTLYGTDHLTLDHKSIVYCEGEMDALVLWSLGIPAVSSTGGALSIPHEVEDLASSGVSTILCFDNDQTGGQGMVRALEVVPDAQVLFLPDRPGMKDISDYVSAGGDMHELLRTAQSFPDIQSVRDDRAQRLSTWRSTYFHDAYITEHTRPSNSYQPSREANGKVEKAKQVSLTSLLSFKQGKTPCIWHNDDTPSLHYYKATNTVYCFGCGKYGDAIDVYRQINDCSFGEAVNKLNHDI